MLGSNTSISDKLNKFGSWEVKELKKELGYAIIYTHKLAPLSCEQEYYRIESITLELKDFNHTNVQITINLGPNGTINAFTNDYSDLISTNKFLHTVSPIQENNQRKFNYYFNSLQNTDVPFILSSLFKNEAYKIKESLINFFNEKLKFIQSENNNNNNNNNNNDVKVLKKNIEDLRQVVGGLEKTIVSLTTKVEAQERTINKLLQVIAAGLKVSCDESEEMAGRPADSSSIIASMLLKDILPSTSNNSGNQAFQPKSNTDFSVYGSTTFNKKS